MVVITPATIEGFRIFIKDFKAWYSALCAEFPFVDPLVRFAVPFFIIYFCVTVICRVFDLNY